MRSPSNNECLFSKIVCFIDDKKLYFPLSVEDDLDLEDGQWEEIHVITGALKLFLRELPEPIFPFSFFDRFIAAIREYNCPVLENK